LKRKYFKKYVFLKLFRFIAWHRKVIFHATDEQERKDILFFFSKKARIFVVENIPGTPFNQWIPKEKNPGELNCVFISRVHPKKNLYYFLKVLTELGDEANLNFDVYGTEEDKSYARDCRQIPALLDSNIQVSFKGPIPHQQVFETIRNYHVFVLPSLGENFGHAIYEALSAGDPVLISDQTPWRNLEKEKAGWDIPLKKRDKFKEAILQAVAWGQEEYNEWSRNAFRVAKKSGDITKLFEKYKQLFG
jgi:glycosyltransferase involved in cell wall biosynthesis